MKYVFGFLAIVALAVSAIFWFNDGQQKPDPENLPWQATLNEQGQVDVFHMTVGQTTLRQMMEQFRSFPEVALFAQKNGSRIVEAYFGKKRVGLFEAKLVAELDVDADTLARFEKNRIEEEPQPSGKWKFTLAEPDMLATNDFAIKHLIYIPIVNYEQSILQQRFGKPAEIIKTKTAAQYWMYPNKGLIVLEDPDGAEIFYYVAKQHFDALKARLVTEGSEHKDD